MTKPSFIDHDHEEYFSCEVICGKCGESLGEYDFGDTWCDGCQERFIEHNQYCCKCGEKIDWDINKSV